MWLRTVLIQFTWRLRSRIHLHDVARLPMRVLPADVDVLRHVNNGVHLSLMDLGRWDRLLHSGVWQRLKRAGVYPVVASSTMTYRKSLQPWHRYVLESRIVGYDERSVYLEQRVIVAGDIVAVGVVRGRFLQRGSGVVPIARIGELAGIDTSGIRVDPWLTEWAAASALPSTLVPAPSAWK